MVAAKVIQFPANQKNCFTVDFPSEESATEFEANITKLRRWTLLAHERGIKEFSVSVCGIKRRNWLTSSAMQLFKLKENPAPRAAARQW